MGNHVIWKILVCARDEPLQVDKAASILTLVNSKSMESDSIDLKVDISIILEYLEFLITKPVGVPGPSRRI